MRGNNVSNRRRPGITWRRTPSNPTSAAAASELSFYTFNFLPIWRRRGSEYPDLTSLHCAPEYADCINLLCQNSQVQKRAPHAAPPACPPVYPGTAARLFGARSLALWPEMARGVWKRSLTLSKGQISHSACLKALGTKATEFPSIKAALAFVPWKRRTRSGPFSRPAPPGVHCQGQPNVCPSSSLTAVPPPRHMHGSARKHAHMCTHTHSTLPSTFSRMAVYNSPGPHQTESPTAPFEK